MEKSDKINEELFAEKLYSQICSIAINGSNFSRVELGGNTDFFLEDTAIIGYFSHTQIKRCIGEISNLEPDFGRAYCVFAKRGSKTDRRNAKYVFNFRPGVRMKEMLLRNIKPLHIFESR